MVIDYGDLMVILIVILMVNGDLMDINGDFNGDRLW